MYILFSGGRIRGNRFYASGWCLGFLLGGAATGICAQRNGGFRRSCFYKAAFEEKDWGTIQVPGHVQLQGYDNCHYVNTMYPWDGRSEIRPPAIDWENAPAGSYVREFIITDQEKDFLENGCLCRSREWKQPFMCGVTVSFQGMARTALHRRSMSLREFFILA